MERTQISLTPEQATRLRALARRRGTSMAALIREAVDRVHPADGSTGAGRWTRALSVVGAFASGDTDVATEHDRYLEDAFSG